MTAHITQARFFAENIAVAAPGLAMSVMEGAAFVHDRGSLGLAP